MLAPSALLKRLDMRRTRGQARLEEAAPSSSEPTTAAGRLLAPQPVAPLPARSTAAAAPAAAAAAGPSRKKRPREDQPFSEDDFSCPICLNLLLVRALLGLESQQPTASQDPPHFTITCLPLFPLPNPTTAIKSIAGPHRVCLRPRHL